MLSLHTLPRQRRAPGLPQPPSLRAAVQQKGPTQPGAPFAAWSPSGLASLYLPLGVANKTSEIHKLRETNKADRQANRQTDNFKPFSTLLKSMRTLLNRSTQLSWTAFSTEAEGICTSWNHVGDHVSYDIMSGDIMCHSIPPVFRNKVSSQ